MPMSSGLVADLVGWFVGKCFVWREVKAGLGSWVRTDLGDSSRLRLIASFSCSIAIASRSNSPGQNEGHQTEETVKMNEAVRKMRSPPSRRRPASLMRIGEREV